MFFFVLSPTSHCACAPKATQKSVSVPIGRKWGQSGSLFSSAGSLFKKKKGNQREDIFFAKNVETSESCAYVQRWVLRSANESNEKKSEGAIREWCSPISVENACFANENVRGLISRSLFFFFSCPGVVREKARLSYRNRQVDKGRKTLTSTTTTRTMALSVRGLPKLSVSPA